MSRPGATPQHRAAALRAIRRRNPGNVAEVQRARLLEAMQTLGHCTTFEASRFLDLYDPRARKMELLRHGYPVLMTWRYIETESGVTHRVGVYSLTRSKP